MHWDSSVSRTSRSSCAEALMDRGAKKFTSRGVRCTSWSLVGIVVMAIIGAIACDDEKNDQLRKPEGTLENGEIKNPPPTPAPPPTSDPKVPSNKSTPVPPQAPKLSEIKLINYDFAKYGSSAERTRLLTKWDKEVYALPK